MHSSERSASSGGPEADEFNDHIIQIVLEYAQRMPNQPVDVALSLRQDLEIESLSLVSLALRLGEEFNVDLADLEGAGVDLSALQTVGDLLTMAHQLVRIGSPAS